MIGRLYADGAMQQTADFRFSVLQGSCVGGSTVVNNAVCFDPPDRCSRAGTTRPAHDAGLDVGAARASCSTRVERAWTCTAQRRARAQPRPAAHYLDGVEAARARRPASWTSASCDANIARLPRLRLLQHRLRVRAKLSMLDTPLPRAQARSPGAACGSSPSARSSGCATLSGKPARVVELRARLAPTAAA